MHHEILGDLYQWLKIEIRSESIQGNYQNLLCKSKEIGVRDETVFFGTGWLIFTGNGKIKEFYLSGRDTVVFSEKRILAADVTVKQESLSTNYVSLSRVTGPGTVFLFGKDFVEFYLEENETIEVKTKCITALDSTITFNLDSNFSVLTGVGAVLLEGHIPEEHKVGSLFDRL